MNRKILGVAVAVLAIAMLAITIVPVSAKAEKVPVVGLNYSIGGLPPSDSWETNGGIAQVRDATVYGKSYYWFDLSAIPGTPPYPYPVPPASSYFNPQPTYVFKSTSIASGMENTKTDQAVSHWDVIMVYPFSGTEQGRFVGQMQVRTDGDVTTMQCVYQGFGLFEGKTLMVSGIRTYSSQPGLIEGYLLTR
jgi:hypothetical protein